MALSVTTAWCPRLGDEHPGRHHLHLHQAPRAGRRQAEAVPGDRAAAVTRPRHQAGQVRASPLLNTNSSFNLQATIHY